MQFRRITIGLLITAITVVSHGETDDIRLNQLGYYPDLPKIAVVVNSSASEFTLIDENNTAMFSGELLDGGFDSTSGKQTRLADFSDFSDEGTFRLSIPDVGTSWPFEISRGLFEKSGVKKHALKTFYFQRASMAIDAPYGENWRRQMGHEDDWQYFFNDWRYGHKNASGGWYDAGDYGKYVVNGGIAVGTLLALYELQPSVYPDGYLNIPESSNGQNDLLDEVKYELDWFHKMQDEKDPATAQGVSHKLGPDTWPGEVAPNRDYTERYISEKSTAATLNFAATNAMAGRLYIDYDQSYAQKCINAAESAWNWALEHDDVPAPNGPSGAGGYNDSYVGDEFFWAAAELYITTGKEEFKNYIVENISSNMIDAQASWPNVGNLGVFSLAVTNNDLEQELKNTLKQSIIGYANTIIQTISTNSYRTPMSESGLFNWGSNGNVANFGIICAYAWYLTGESKYLDALAVTSDYLFGKNATALSFVTGYGDKTPMHPHHRPSGADNVEEPVPGFLVGGPNQSRQDTKDGVKYDSDLPALCYVDIYSSYASNEVAINWNAPFVFITAFMDEATLGLIEPMSVAGESRLSAPKGSPILSLTIQSDAWKLSFRSGERAKRISVHDSRGRRIKTIIPSRQTDNRFSLPTSDLNSGWYCVSVESGGVVHTLPITHLR